MRSIVRPVAVALPVLAAVLLLTGCSAEPTVDQGALRTWQKQQDAAVERDDAVLGVLTAAIDAEQGEPSRPGSDISLHFPASQRVDHVEFSCFGNGSMRAVVRVTSASGSRAVTTDPMSCRDSPHRIALGGSTAAVDGIGCSGFDSDRASEWRLVIVGATPSGD
ncbi:hypothetical protein [Curtobacterium pusillum]|uniref:hypothetical protein n=1 Tax=Curtobacterium pusillum TaxID=69373 RepID=UPI00119E2C16|nr:hypothetical protein [Curtobacterium pusillum]